MFIYLNFSLKAHSTSLICHSYKLFHLRTEHLCGGGLVAVAAAGASCQDEKGATRADVTSSKHLPLKMQLLSETSALQLKE